MKESRLFPAMNPALKQVAAGQPDAGKVELAAPPVKKKNGRTKSTVYFSEAVHDKLRDIAHAERKSINDLLMEGLDRVLENRSYPNTKQLTERAKNV